MDSSSMPPPPPRPRGKEADLRKQALTGTDASIPGMGSGLLGLKNPAPSTHLPPTAHDAVPRAAAETQETLDAEDWHAYWDECKQVQVPDRNGVFNVYCAGTIGPILLAIHGAGYTGRTWSLVAASLKNRYRIVAPDLRGHGLTNVLPETDFSKETLADDVIAIWHALFQPTPGSMVSTQQAPLAAGQLTQSPVLDSTIIPAATMQQPTATAEATTGDQAASAAVDSTALQSASVAPTPMATPGAAAPALATQGTAHGAAHGAAPAAHGASHGPAHGAAAAGGDPLATLIVGHSMGGAVAVWAAASRKIRHLAGCVVVDVVEGTAIAALPHMNAVIATRPTTFASPQAAIKWALQSGMSRCKAAARVSLPSQLTPNTSTAPEHSHSFVSGQLHTSVLDASVTSTHTIAEQRRQQQHARGHLQPSLMTPHAAIPEGNDEQEDNGEPCSQVADHAQQPAAAVDASHTQPVDGQEQAVPLSRSQQEAGSSAGQAIDRWRWRTPLTATQPYWHGWYTGLSDAFLSLNVPKMLLLAGTDRLDKALTIGQMQGKFQLVLLPTSGHAIQEDDAAATAAALDSFAVRQCIGQPPLVLPRAPPGTRPVLPVVAGPVLQQ